MQLLTYGFVMSEIYDTFKRAFILIKADTPELKQKVYQLRYQVYCLQLKLPGFCAANYPDKLEKDQYDDHSCHTLIQFVPTGEFVGTTRLILPNPLNPEKKLPIEEHTQIDPGLLVLDSETRKHTAEISRFLVTPHFDRRKGDRRKNAEQNRKSSTPETTPDNTQEDRRKGDRRTADRRSTLNIYMVLMAAVVRMTVEHDVQYWLSAMEPTLNRLLSFTGLDGRPVGPLANFHGPRRPYFGVVKDMLDKLYARNFGAWEVITDRGKYWHRKVPVKKL